MAFVARESIFSPKRSNSALVSAARASALVSAARESTVVFVARASTLSLRRSMSTLVSVARASTLPLTLVKPVLISLSMRKMSPLVAVPSITASRTAFVIASACFGSIPAASRPRIALSVSNVLTAMFISFVSGRI